MKIPMAHINAMIAIQCKFSEVRLSSVELKEILDKQEIQVFSDGEAIIISAQTKRSEGFAQVLQAYLHQFVPYVQYQLITPSNIS